MKQKNLSNQELAKIERSLFKSVQQNKTDLNEILDSPNLFNSIKKQINQKKAVPDNPTVRLRFAAYAFFSVLVVSFLIFPAYYFVNLTKDISDKAVSVSQPEKEFKPTIEEKSEPILDEQPQPVSENKPRSFVENKRPKAIKPTQTIAKETRKSPLKPEKIKKTSPKSKKVLPEQNSPFYAINRIGNDDSLNEGMSIIRADFSRAELSAMGIEILNDIGDSRVKAEVLVGNDGQPRGIRFMK